MSRSEDASEKGGKGAAIEIAPVDSHDSADVHEPQSYYVQSPPRMGILAAMLISPQKR